MLSTDPVIHELGRRLVAERRVTAHAIVERLDVVEQVPPVSA